MTITKLIDQTARCVKCGATLADGCDCWVALKCPRCGKTRRTERDKTDPPRTAVVRFICNDCDQGDFSECLYFDADGKQLDVL